MKIKINKRILFSGTIGLLYILAFASGHFISMIVEPEPLINIDNQMYRAAYLFSMMMVMTSIIIIVVKIDIFKYIQFLVSLGVILLIVGSVLYIATVDVLAAVILAVLFYLVLRFPQIPTAMAMGLAASVVASSFNPFWGVFIFLVVSIYDFIAIFITKHFKPIIENKETLTWFTFDLYGVGFLGFGDITIPMITIFTFTEIISPILIVFVTIPIMMGGLFHLLLNKDQRPMPALPPLFITTMIGLYAAAVIQWWGLKLM